MKRILFLVLAAVIAVFCGTAYSVTVNDSLYVSTTIIPACSVSTTGVNFGSHSGGSTVYANGDVTVTCASGTVYNIALDAGLAFTGEWRTVVNGLGNYIWYGLYKDASYSISQEWGDSDFAGTYPWGSSLADTGTGSAQPHTVYGDLMALGADPAGTYTDVVTVTVHY